MDSTAGSFKLWYYIVGTGFVMGVSYATAMIAIKRNSTGQEKLTKMTAELEKEICELKLKERQLAADNIRLGVRIEECRKENHELYFNPVTGVARFMTIDDHKFVRTHCLENLDQIFKRMDDRAVVDRADYQRAIETMSSKLEALTRELLQK